MRIVIVGAGISGLSIAYRLQQRLPTADLTVLEQGHRPGGTIWTERRDGFQIEQGANGFLDSKPSTLALCRDLGLEKELIPAREVAGRNRYLLWQGRLHPLPGSLRALLSSGLLSWRGKLELLAEPFRRRRRGRADESVDAFARRRAGSEAAEVFADALVTGIHAGDPELLSIRAAFPRLARLEQQYGSVLRGVILGARRHRARAAATAASGPRAGTMWSFRSGLRQLIETLGERLASPPLLGAGVRRVQYRGTVGQRPSWTVYGEGQDRWPADAVVLACPAYQQAALLHDVDRELADHLAGIAYNRVAVVALGYRRADVPGSLDGFGFIVPQRSRRDLLGVQWCSSIFPDRAPEGAVLLRAMCGGWHRPEMVGWEEARLLQAVRSELQLVMGIRAEPRFHSIVRWDRAIPQYHLGHLERVAWIEQRAVRYPGLFLAGNAYHGVALNDCTERAEIVAGQVVQFMEAAERKAP